MRHPFELQIDELEAIELSHEEEVTDEESNQILGSELTRALFEGGGLTTLALGEEGGCHLPSKPVFPPIITLAMGEEGGWFNKP